MHPLKANSESITLYSLSLSLSLSLSHTHTHTHTQYLGHISSSLFYIYIYIYIYIPLLVPFYINRRLFPTPKSRLVFIFCLAFHFGKRLFLSLACLDKIPFTNYISIASLRKSSRPDQQRNSSEPSNVHTLTYLFILPLLFIIHSTSLANFTKPFHRINKNPLPPEAVQVFVKVSNQADFLSNSVFSLLRAQMKNAPITSVDSATTVQTLFEIVCISHSSNSLLFCVNTLYCYG